MSDWVERWPEDRRPRWGTYSVKTHQDLPTLISDLLGYDVLVFPAPDTEDEFQRWEDREWDPGLLAHRVTQLGDHAVVTPWDEDLRRHWKYLFEQLSPEARADPEAAFTTTSGMLADLPLNRLMGVEDDRYPQAVLDRPKLHPAFAARDAVPLAKDTPLELVAVFGSAADSVWLTGTSGEKSLRRDNHPSTGEVHDAVRMRLRVAVPDGADEATLFRTLDLIEDSDFQAARRRLWSWEKTLPVAPDPQDSAAELRGLVEGYNAAVRQEVKTTRLTWAFLVVPAAVGIGIDLVSGGWVGSAASAGSGIGFDRVKARFPQLRGAGARASHHPGSAVNGLVAIGGTGRPG